MAKELAQHYNTIWVPEYAREYMDGLDRPYQREDLLDIAKGQLVREDQAIEDATDILICDTNLWVIKVWSEVKYSSCHPWIEEQISRRVYDLYLLTDTDIPWQADPQREHPKQRDMLFQIYQEQLGNQSVPFKVLAGDREDRLQSAIAIIDSLV